MRHVHTTLALVFAAGCSGSGRPGGPTALETSLQSYESCADLETDLKEMLLEEVEAQFDQERSWQRNPWGWFEGDTTTGAPPGGPAASDAGPRQEGTDYSGTNNQEAGVDEADFVKTDGHHIYMLNGNRLHVYAVPEFGELVPESVLELEGYPTQLLLDKESGRVAVFSHIDAHALPAGHPLRESVGERDPRGNWSYRVPMVSKITVVEAGNRRAPRLGREIYLEGSYQTARLVERSVRVGAYTYMNVPGIYGYYWDGGGRQLTIDEREAAAKAAIRALKLHDLVPRIYERLPDRTFNTHLVTDNSCRSFYRPTDSQGRGITSILSFDLASANLRMDHDHIVTNSSNLYASKDYLYVTEATHDWWWFWWNKGDDDFTNIHAFDISRAGESRYVGSGRVRGRIENSFSMGEHEGNLRLASTTDRFGRWWLRQAEVPPSENHVFVLAPRDGKLVQIGHLGGIAPGERIFSARFVGDRAYVVTFLNVDPLFTIDLSDPTAPKILGELKVPGVSTYIHPLGDGRLLTVGYGGDDQMLNWRPQVSLFDVSDEAHPALLATHQIAGGEYSWSEALYEHKAFQYWAPRKLLAIPVSSYRGFGDGMGWSWSYSSRLMLISVGDRGLSLHGSLDHSKYYNRDSSQQWIFTDVRRSIFMGDFIYAISDRGISVNRIDTLAPVTEQELPGFSPTHYYWWW
jgi:hypothetical protein